MSSAPSSARSRPRSTPRINPRIAARRAEVRRERMLRRRRRTLIVFVAAVVAAVLYLVEQSPLLALAEVRISGVDRLDAETVRDSAALPLGTSTLRLDLDDAERRVEALPLVLDAEVRRLDPLTVEIDVMERVPRLVVVTAAGPVLVDADGAIVSRGRVEGLPVIATKAPRRPAPGDQLSSVAGAAEAHAVWRELPADVRGNVTRYEAEPEEITLVLRDGVRARFGRADRVDEKARALRALLRSGEELGAVDVRAPANPVAITR